MKICFITTNLGYSGASKMMAWVAERMAERGHQVSILSMYGEVDGQQPKNVSVVKLGARKSKNRIIRNTVGMAETLVQLNRYVKNKQTDVIITFLDSVSEVYMALNSVFGGLPIIASERSDPYTHHGFTGGIRDKLLDLAAGVVFQTGGAREYYKQQAVYGRSVVIPNPVVLKESGNEVPRFASRDRRVVSVGRLDMKQKRPDVMIRAFEMVHRAVPDVRLVMYGTGGAKAQIEGMIAEAGIKDWVTLAGKTTKVYEDTHTASAFVLSSDFEGIPNALIEAMSCGIPSVSTDCSPGGARMLIRDGENGFLVPCGDPDAMARRIIQVLTEPETADRFSANGPKIKELLSEDRIADLWEKYILNVINKK